MIALLETLGEASISALWIPVAVWSVVAVATEAGLGRWGGRAPATAYRLAQAVLLALPLGLLVSLAISPDWLASWKPEVVLEVVPASGVGAPVASPPVETVGVPSMTIALGLLTLLAGATCVIGLGRIALQTRHLHRLRRALPEADSEAAREDAAAVATQVGLRAAPDVLVTPAEVVPMTLGVRRPLVVLPDRLGAAERRLALAHEFQHIRQADPLAHWAEAITDAVFAFHPLVSLLVRRCDLYREMTCDAAVLAGPEVDRRSYAALISSFATSARPSWSPVAVGMAARTPHVHQRLLAMKHLAPSRASRLAGPLALAVLASGILLMTVGRAAAQPAPVTIVESAPEAVIYVDGERFWGSIDDIDPAEILTIDVTKSDEIHREYGVDGIIRVTTRAGAAAGLTGEPDDILSRFPNVSTRDVVTETVFEEDDGQTIGVYRRDADSGVVSVSRTLASGGRTFFRVGECGETPCAGVVVSELEAAPLVFVDGVRVAGPDAVPDDVASVEVIKGEGALEYGAGEGQGVILVSTESGARRAASTEAASEPASGFTAVARPNPADDEVEFVLDLPEAEVVGVEVYDLTGRLVQKQSYSLRVDASALPAGGYVARVTAYVDGELRTTTSRFSVSR